MAEFLTIEPREVNGQPSTKRVERRYRELLDREPCIDSQRAVLHTEYIREHFTEPRYLRAGGALRHVLSNLTPAIHDDELLVGNVSRYFKGTQVYPEYEPWMIEAFDHVRREEERYTGGTLPERAGERLGVYVLSAEDRDAILTAARVWQGKDWRSLAEQVLRATRPDRDLVEKWMQQLVFLRFMFDVPEGRVIVDYARVINEGIAGLEERIDHHLAVLGSPATKEAFDRYNFYRGVKLALEGVVAFAASHAALAEEQARACADASRRAELLEESPASAARCRSDAPTRSARHCSRSGSYTSACSSS